MSEAPLHRALLSEFIATALLLIAVVGSGIAAERLSGGSVALALLANAIATGAALYALITAFGPISGAHMNPLVTVAAAILDGFSWRFVAPYVCTQIAAAICGVFIAHIMFDLPLLQASGHSRAGVGLWVGEGVATAGLLLVIWGNILHDLTTTAAAVALYITGAYWFTSSTSFANPAVTIARSLTDTFAGIAPGDVAGFIAAQALGAALAIVLIRAMGLDRRVGP